MSIPGFPKHKCIPVRGRTVVYCKKCKKLLKEIH